MEEYKNNITIQDFATPYKPTWCPGCGDFSIWLALRQAFVHLGLQPHEVYVVFDIGCSGNMCNFVNAYGAHGLHGRALPLAFGLRLANHGMPVVVIGGDGGSYGEGGNHFIHTIRANPNITYIVHDNQVYGLTIGQTSPTSDKGAKAKTNPQGVIDEPINPLALAISAGCGYVARGFSGDIPYLTQQIVSAMEFKGFSLVDVFQPCVTFNKVNTYQYFRERVYKLEETSHDVSNKVQAFERALEQGDHLPIGLFYKEEKQVYESALPQLEKKSLVEQSHSYTPGSRDLTPVVESFM
ncbi:MAG: 2-oxoacid ferredoxin oxidoreductase, subunit beta [Parcubacteria group bacterium GW2011_GWA2_43_13]|nr:MAG: 2-oxoacid ferredoxin oxidoreductase, subunit beta [Parcubacteria group bacterium GW2011_GWA2_43_13]OGY71027.1 MAG: 2-oxoacid ferredoxin oxidoreductase [Candidatus Jacksonbacteria bacterium RIFCSPLOWO2_01_FULL_44_13]HAZ16906.1 2-oxoacid ferredoxin oxidoreductase [Candidatus Jacksonbacteria bacterium]